MNKIKNTINNVVREIQEQQSYPQIELKQEHNITRDLGFISLDIAQLIASLEMELGVDPFAQGVLLTEVTTIGKLYNVYESHMTK